MRCSTNPISSFRCFHANAPANRTAHNEIATDTLFFLASPHKSTLGLWITRGRSRILYTKQRPTPSPHRFSVTLVPAPGIPFQDHARSEGGVPEGRCPHFGGTQAPPTALLPQARGLKGGNSASEQEKTSKPKQNGEQRQKASVTNTILLKDSKRTTLKSCNPGQQRRSAPTGREASLKNFRSTR